MLIYQYPNLLRHINPYKKITGKNINFPNHIYQNIHQQYYLNYYYFINLKISKQQKFQQVMNPNSTLIDKDQLQQYFIIKRTTMLPPKINMLFNILQKVIQFPQQLLNIDKQGNKTFLQTFSKLGIGQQSRYMCACIKYTVKYLMQKNSQIIKNNQIRNIETTVSIYATYFKIPIWQEYNFKFDKNKRIIILHNKKKNQILNLEYYLIRRSKKYKSCIVLQGYHQTHKLQNKKYILSFKQNLGEHIYNQIFETIIQIKQSQLQLLIKTNQKQQQKQINTLNYLQQKNSMVFLSPKNINQFLNYKQNIMKYLLRGKFEFKQISKIDRIQYKIQHSDKNNKIFKMQGNLKQQAKQAKKILLNNFGNYKNKLIISSQILQKFSNKYYAVYQKYLFGNKIQQLITIKQQNFSQQEDVLFIKGMQNVIIKKFIQFLFIKIKYVSQNQSKLVIICSVLLNDLITIDTVKLYLFTLYENCCLSKGKQLIQTATLIPIKQQQSQDKYKSSYQFQKQKDQFFTIYDQQIVEEEYFQFIEGQEQIKGMQKIPVQQLNQKVTQKLQVKYLRHKYQLVPIQNFNKNQHLMKQHYLFTDWERRKQGGVICKNQQIVSNQKRLFKDLITRVGTNILKSGGNVLNISIPVIVFKKQSHLFSIARDFAYAPLFFENVTDKLQRVKYATLLAISVGTLGISMQKPFNPLLGQTLQAWIGGCPIYLQQIKHHPPIGAYYFVGRGFKIYGEIEPKISFGVNNIKGYSQKPNHLVFDDGTNIQMAYGKMMIHGILFGQRQFNYDDKIFAYDKKNHIFSQVNYGPRKKSMLGKSSEPWDFCYGKIYQLKPEFLQIFQNSHPSIYPTKEYIIKQLSNIQGIWNQAILFDGVQYVNFKTKMPCQIQQQPFSLPSNSNFRKDLQSLMKGNINQAQQQKQIMEEIQRRDRKLRQQYQNKSNQLIQNKQIKIKKSVTK